MQDRASFLDIAGRYPLLSQREEILLGRRIQAWLTHPAPCPPEIERSGRRARDRFVLCNLRLVASIAKHYNNKAGGTSLSYSDLLQEGAIGLQRAAEKYSPDCGYKMSTYASWWIRQSLSRLVEKNTGAIRITRTAKLKLKAYEDAEAQGGTPAEILERSGMKKRDLALIIGARECMRVGSLDDPDNAGRFHPAAPELHLVELVGDVEPVETVEPGEIWWDSRDEYYTL